MKFVFQTSAILLRDVFACVVYQAEESRFMVTNRDAGVDTGTEILKLCVITLRIAIMMALVFRIDADGALLRAVVVVLARQTANKI